VWADNPSLTTRLWPGANPLRLVIDMHLRLPGNLRVFDDSAPTIVFNLLQHTVNDSWKVPNARRGVVYYQVTEDASLVHQLLNGLYHLNIQSVLVEGGAQLLQSFIDEGSWDEARVITNLSLIAGEGLPAPRFDHYRLQNRVILDTDEICFYQPIYHT
jgi:diaminohydroxyphosphoribosylaminopyrimidine deaminase/5-amino-6-(5-phosphoribosylamino)uracil reductase